VKPVAHFEPVDFPAPSYDTKIPPFPEQQPTTFVRYVDAAYATHLVQ